MDHRLDYPATGRNRDVILDVLRRHLPATGLVVEIASGSGQHHVHFARHLPQLTFQPTDLDPAGLRSIAAWQAHEGLTNVRPPLELDVTADWPVQRADAVLCINMIHISPWACTQALMAGAARLIRPGGVLFLYGPYRVDGRMVASNERFDASLRSRDPSWGVRDLDAVLDEARGFSLIETVAMPANNLSVVLRRGTDPGS